ncbi:MAG: polysaccharide biosynthesis protein [Thermosphaera sp.]
MLKGLVIAGYGGHAGYAYAVSVELVKRGVELDILLPRGYRFLERRFEKLGEIIHATLPRKPLEPFHRGLHRWFKAFAESLSLARRSYDFAFATGSNFSIPASLTLKILRRTKVYTLEAVDRVLKRTKAVSILYKTGATVFLPWEEQLEMYPRGVVVGPIYEPLVYEPRNDGYVLITTGTLGAEELFEAAVELDVEKMVVQTGDVDPAPYAARKPGWVFFQYTEDLYKWIAGARIVVTHPGITAATARFAYGKPVVIAYTRRHSKIFTRREVEAFAEKLNAAFLDEATPSKLAEALREAENSRVPAYPNGAVKIAEYITTPLGLARSE